MHTMNSPARARSDEDLLDLLATAYPVEECEPSWSSLHQLSIAVAELRRGESAPAPVPLARRARQGLRLRMPRRMGPVIIVGSVVGVFATGTGISYAAGVPIPAAVRSVARAVGLDNAPPPSTLHAVIPTTTTTPLSATTSPTVSAARQAESARSHALGTKNVPSGVISRDSAVLSHRLAEGEGRRVAGAAAATAEGRHLAQEACQQLGGSAQSASGSVTATTSSAVTTSTGVTCTAAHGVVPGPGSTATGGAASVPSRTSGVATSTLPASPTGAPTSTPPIGHPGNGTGPEAFGHPLAPTATTPGLSSGASRVHPLNPPAEGVPTTMNHIPSRRTH